MLKLFLSVLFLVGILMGHPPSSAKDRSIIVIFIRTADGRAGVQSTVTLGRVVQPTDTQGKVVFSGFRAGKYELYVSPAPPYKGFRWVVTAPVDAPIIFKLDRP